MLRKVAIVTALTLGLAACNTTGSSSSGNKQTAGTLLGAVGGAIAGAQIGKGKGRMAAVAAGTLLGAIVGNQVGQSLDRADRLAMEQTTQNTLEESPSGTTVNWSNPDSGNSGTVTPTKTYQTSAGNYCREFTQTVQIGGRSEEAYGTACRQPDGSWKVVN
jgi:surface antigen